MSNAALASTEVGTEPTALPYRCAAEGCLADTADNYCASHAVTCDECGGEWMAGDLKPAASFRGPSIGRAMWCPECVRAACKGDSERCATDCFCGHRAVRS